MFLSAFGFDLIVIFFFFFFDKLGTIFANSQALCLDFLMN